MLSTFVDIQHTDLYVLSCHISGTDDYLSLLEGFALLPANMKEKNTLIQTSTEDEKRREAS